jgi:NAD(P)-dependent dehydrogenase (short-subunit alcohol dehydrogenase family)
MDAQTVIITGAASGIGRATALIFAKAGIQVVVSDVQEAAGHETAADIKKAGGRAVFVKADVAQAADANALVAAAVKEFGRVDMAFNNAGIEVVSTPFADMSDADWSRVIAVNLTGVFHCMRAELKQMLAQKSGSILNMASIAGLIGFAGSGAYCASKHGVIGITKAAALEVATQGIRVNAVCPGVIRTAMIDRVEKAQPALMKAITAAHPMGRIGHPEEVGVLALSILRDMEFVTGQAIAIDGGYTVQ